MICISQAGKKMRTLRFSLVMALAVLMSISAASHSEGGRSGGSHWSGGRGGGHHDGHRCSFGVVIGNPYWGAPWYSPWYYPYYPYAPLVSVPSEPQEQEYIERSQDNYSSRPGGVWYYCAESKAYYPYVRECPDGWQTVPAQPPSGRGR